MESNCLGTGAPNLVVSEWERKAWKLFTPSLSGERFRIGYCPCQANCGKWIPKEGEYLLFKDHHCKGRLWGYWCICFSPWRLVWGWIHLCWMFSHLLQLWGGDYPRIFPLLNGDKGRCARLWRTHWERGGAAHHCVSSLWSWGRRADRSGSGLVLFLMTPRGWLEGDKTRQGKLW